MGQLNLNKGDGDFLDNPPNLMNPQMGGFQLDPSQFDQVGIDPVQFDYGSQLGGAPSMDSPNYNMDYQQQVGLGVLMARKVQNLSSGSYDMEAATKRNKA